MSYKEDVKFVGAFIRGGDWEIGLRIARNVFVSESETDSAENRVSMKKFAADSGIGYNTIKRYLDAWEAAANDGYVDPASILQPDDEYEWTKTHTQELWNMYYSTGRYGSANPESKRKPSKKEIVEAIKDDVNLRIAAREAIRVHDEAIKHERMIKDDFGIVVEERQENPDDLTYIFLTYRSIKRRLQEYLEMIIDCKEERSSIISQIEDLENILTAAKECAKGRTMDEEIQKILEEESDV